MRDVPCLFFIQIRYTLVTDKEHFAHVFCAFASQLEKTTTGLQKKTRNPRNVEFSKQTREGDEQLNHISPSCV